MKILTHLLIMAIIALPVAVNAGEGNDKHADQKKNEAKLQATCPVMGGKINKDLYVDHEGHRIYVCCKGCIAKVKAEPEKYIKKLEAKGETVAKLQTSCPVTGEKIDKSLYVDHEGHRIYVCCKGCIPKVKAEPEKYIEKLAAEGEVPHSVEGDDDQAEKEGSHKKKEGSHHR